MHGTFARLVDHTGIGPRPPGRRPRLHDIRHSLACTVLINWYRDGVDVEANLPLLSTYLGHGSPTKGSQTVFARHWPGRGVFV
jgi:integrase